MSTISTNTTITQSDISNNVYTWPITIIGATKTVPLSVTLAGAITFDSSSQFFIIGSDYITISGSGSGSAITIQNVLNYPGLVQNGTSSSSGGYAYTSIVYITIKTSGTSSLAEYAGWICQKYFSGRTFQINNCTNYGDIGNYSGGLIGAYAFSYDPISSTVPNSVTILYCTNYGAINGTGAGGIIGGNMYGSTTNINNGKLSITWVSNNGDINGSGAGGLIGQGAQYNSTSCISYISQCSNLGTIANTNNNCGALIGYSANNSNGTNTIYVIQCTGLNGQQIVGNQYSSVLNLYINGSTNNSF